MNLLLLLARTMLLLIAQMLLIAQLLSVGLGTFLLSALQVSGSSESLKRKLRAERNII